MRLALLCSSLLIAASAHAQDIDALTKDTREKALPVLPKVVKMMQDTVAAEGVAGAIPICKDKAPALLKQRAEELGWQMRRVSLKTRNPERGTPDAWERKHLEAFDQRAAAGEGAAALEVLRLEEQVTTGHRVERPAGEDGGGVDAAADPGRGGQRSLRALA